MRTSSDTSNGNGGLKNGELKVLIGYSKVTLKQGNSLKIKDKNWKTILIWNMEEISDKKIVLKPVMWAVNPIVFTDYRAAIKYVQMLETGGKTVEIIESASVEALLDDVSLTVKSVIETRTFSGDITPNGEEKNISNEQLDTYNPQEGDEIQGNLHYDRSPVPIPFHFRITRVYEASNYNYDTRKTTYEMKVVYVDANNARWVHNSMWLKDFNAYLKRHSTHKIQTGLKVEKREVTLVQANGDITPIDGKDFLIPEQKKAYISKAGDVITWEDMSGQYTLTITDIYDGKYISYVIERKGQQDEVLQYEDSYKLHSIVRWHKINSIKRGKAAPKEAKIVFENIEPTGTEYLTYAQIWAYTPQEGDRIHGEDNVYWDRFVREIKKVEGWNVYYAITYFDGQVVEKSSSISWLKSVMVSDEKVILIQVGKGNTSKLAPKKWQKFLDQDQVFSYRKLVQVWDVITGILGKVFTDAGRKDVIEIVWVTNTHITYARGSQQFTIERPTFYWDLDGKYIESITIK